jgi:hypothetical protein
MHIDEECARVSPSGSLIYYAGIAICHGRKWGDRMVPTSWVPRETPGRDVV